MIKLPRLPALDRRLSRIAEQVPKCQLAADIGADHGKLSCHLLHSSQVQRMIVSDISKFSRDKARDLFVRHGLMDRVVISGEDGLYALLGQKADAVIIAGMGGALIAYILNQEVGLHGARLILGAQTELPKVRLALHRRGYRIDREVLTFDKGRFYRIIVGSPGTQTLSPREMALGYHVQETPEAAFKDYLLWQMQVTRSWQGEKGRELRHHLQEALDEQASSKRENHL